MEKTTKNGIHRIRQEGGKTIAWAEESGVKVLEKDGYYFKDLAKTGELLPYENWRLSDEERAADHCGPSFHRGDRWPYVVLTAPGRTADAGRSVPGNV